jgi:hypothetical protein
MKGKRITIIAVFLCLITQAPACRADEDSTEGDRSREVRGAPEESAKPADTAAKGSVGPPIYVPPSRKAPRTRVGGATRSPLDTAPNIEVLAPPSIGLTLESEPVVYWYLPEPTGQRVALTVASDTSERPVLEARLDPPEHAGVHAIRLADHGLELEMDVDYEWFLSIAGDPDRRERDQFAGGSIARIEAPADLARKLATASEERRSHVLAEAGIWYDALHVLSQRIDAAPGDLELRRQRADLLAQVGLEKVARAERARAVQKPEQSDAGSVRLPVYSPPKPVRASYPRHLTGLGARGTGPGEAAFRLFALAPNHLGVTVREQPTFYWYLERDSDVPAEFTLVDVDGKEPLLKIAFPPPLSAGYHGVDLAEHGVRLETGTTYEWATALVPGGRQVHPTISVGFVERRPPDANLDRELADTDAAGAVHVYARHGLWYEALDDVSRRIAADPHDPAPRLQRAALLDQVGLTPVAEHARLAVSELR